MIRKPRRWVLSSISLGKLTHRPSAEGGGRDTEIEGYQHILS